MTPERASLIQSLAREEIGNMILERCSCYPDKWRIVADDWCRRVDAANFDASESAEFQRVRQEFRSIAFAVLDFAATGGVGR